MADGASGPRTAGTDSIGHFIGGRHIQGQYRKTFGVTDPATGQECARVQVGRGADVNRAVQAAREAFAKGPWPGLDDLERASVLDRIAETMSARTDEIAAAEALCTGLPVSQAAEQAALAAGHFRHAAELSRARREQASRPPGRGGYLRRPVGVAGVATSWRSPFLEQARALAPVWAAGCTAVLSPHPWAPLSASLLPEITSEAGLPDGVLNIVHGSGSAGDDAHYGGGHARILISHLEVAAVSFSGERTVAEQLRAEAAAHDRPLSLDFPVPAPCLIFADADLDRAVDAALFGAFGLNGTRRTASAAVLVEQPAYDTVAGALAERAGRIRTGSPSDPATELGPLAHPDHYDRVMALVRLGLREGARLTAGGRRPSDLEGGSYLAATVLADVTPDMRTFDASAPGPVIRITPFSTENEAASLAKIASHGTTAYLWTTDPERASRTITGTGAAATWVNASNPQDLRMPPGVDGPGHPASPWEHSQVVHAGADEEPIPRFGILGPAPEAR